MRYKTNRVILVKVDLVISLFLVGIFWQTNASERKTNKISRAPLNPNFCQEVLVTTLYIQSTASHSVLWTDEDSMRAAWRKREREKKSTERPSVAEQERQSDATNLNSKTWCEWSRQDAALL